jgi:toxin ParE1/3/4
MVEIRLRPRAEWDFIEIGDYTRQQWSESQSEIYLQKILDVIRQIGDQPSSGEKVDYARAGYRRRRAGLHLIFYVMSDGSVEIVRILHERSDVVRHIDGN